MVRMGCLVEKEEEEGDVGGEKSPRGGVNR